MCVFVCYRASCSQWWTWTPYILPLPPAWWGYRHVSSYPATSSVWNHHRITQKECYGSLRTGLFDIFFNFLKFYYYSRGGRAHPQMPQCTGGEQKTAVESFFSFCLSVGSKDQTWVIRLARHVPFARSHLANPSLELMCIYFIVWALKGFTLIISGNIFYFQLEGQ